MEFQIKKALLILSFDKTAKNIWVSIFPKFLIFNNDAEAKYWLNQKNCDIILLDGKLLANYEGIQVGEYRYSDYLKIKS